MTAPVKAARLIYQGMNMKNVLKVVVGLALSLIVPVLLVVFTINAIVEGGIESAGKRSLGVEVELSRASLSLLEGHLALSGVRIANPEGFKTFQLLKAEGVTVAMKPVSIVQDEVLIDSFVIESPFLTVEHSLRGANIGPVLKSIQMEKGEKRELSKQKRYRIERLRIAGGQVVFASMVKPAATVNLPDIELRDISGADGKGVPLGQVCEKVLLRMIQTAIKSEPGTIPPEMLSALTGEIKQYVPEFEIGVFDRMRGFFQRSRDDLRELFDKEEAGQEATKSPENL